MPAMMTMATKASMRLLLLSNSTNFGSGYLDHAASGMARLFAGVRRVLFVPFALRDQEAYAGKARRRLADLGLEVDRLEEGAPAIEAVRRAEAFFVGGGNTFRLLAKLQASGVVEEIRRRVLEGAPYMGASAGTVITAPTIMTTNDMPIVRPASFDSLGLVPFQINCHYLDADPASMHMGETREQRLREFHEENDAAVVGLREGSILEVARSDSGVASATLAGTAGARVFRRGLDPVEHAPGSSLDYLLV